MDSTAWAFTIADVADRSWNYEYNCHSSASGTPARYGGGVFIIDNTCAKERAESVPLSFKLDLKPLHHSSWNSVHSQSCEKSSGTVSSAINQNTSDTDPKQLTDENCTSPLELSRENSDTDSDQSVGSYCSSRRSSISHPSHNRFLRRSNSCPLDRCQKPVERCTIKPGNSCGQLLVKTSYIPRQYQSLPQKEKDPSTSGEASGFVISNRPRRMKERYISLGARILSLFTLGAVFAVVLNFLQKQKNVTVFSPGIFGDVLNCEWWMLPAFGIAAAVIGLLYPFMDRVMGSKKTSALEWSNVMRCIAVFVGINHATARINFESNIHLAMTLAVLSLGLWYFFDKSLLGLALCVLGTGVATVITQLLVAAEVFGYSNPDFLYMRSWVPCLYFSGGITVGVVGRALAKLDSDYAAKEHQD